MPGQMSILGPFTTPTGFWFDFAVIPNLAQMTVRYPEEYPIVRILWIKMIVLYPGLLEMPRCCYPPWSLNRVRCDNSDVHSSCSLIFILFISAVFEYVEPDFEAYSLGDPYVMDDPYVDQMWYLDAIGASGAWQRTQGAPEVRICVIDTGVDLHHEDLQDNFHSFGYDSVLRQYTRSDLNGHGTMCAGIIGASANNARGTAGLMWSSDILSCRFLGEDGKGFLSDAIRCIQYCADKGARIVSNSWGTYSYSQALKDAMEYYAEQYGIIYTSAAGNEGLDNDGPSPMYPASFDLPSIISVAATDQSGFLAPFSNYGGKTVHIAAPGEHIVSTWRNNTYRGMSGTSFATPMVASALGLMISVNPQVTSERLKEVLFQAATKSPILANRVIQGRFLNISAAVESILEYSDDRLTEEPVTNRPVYVDSIDVSFNSLPWKSERILMPDGRVTNISFWKNFDSNCPKSRYPRYNFRSYLDDNLIPKHVYIPTHTSAVVGQRIAVDTCIQPGGHWDSILILLECDEIFSNCSCVVNNDGCGRRRGGKLRFKVKQSREYMILVLPSDPLETGKYKLRIRPSKHRML
jgi:thermitase